MVIDFFIHPEHAISTGYPYIEVYAKYFSHLDDVLRQSEFPVLVTGHEQGIFDFKFPDERKIASTSYYTKNEIVDRGEVSPSDWDKFVKLLDCGDSYRVHGTYLGQCTEGFAVQLFGYLKRKEHWHNWTGIINEKERAVQKKLIKKHKRRGDFRNSPIKYGVVLNPSYGIRISRPPLSWIFLEPYGNITSQLMDEKTFVY